MKEIHAKIGVTIIVSDDEARKLVGNGNEEGNKEEILLSTDDIDRFLNEGTIEGDSYIPIGCVMEYKEPIDKWILTTAIGKENTISQDVKCMMSTVSEIKEYIYNRILDNQMAHEDTYLGGVATINDIQVNKAKNRIWGLVKFEGYFVSYVAIKNSTIENIII